VTHDSIHDVAAATIRAPLPEEIRFGDWIMRHREFVLVRVRAVSGLAGFAFSLTRDGPVAAAVSQCVSGQYQAGSYHSPAALFERALGANLPSLSAGIGMRALSLVDLATWDLRARSEGVSITRLLGGTAMRMPATAIIGYPPGSTDADAVKKQVSALKDRGWRRFKIAIALPLERGRDRVLAAREAAGEDAWLGVDGAWVFRRVDEAVAFLDSVRDARLGWFEDVFPPGDAQIVAELRGRAGTAIAMGDEQGGSYFPEALLERRAVDVVRVDLTCMGGLTRARDLIDRCKGAAVAFAPHMYAHVHSQAFAALGEVVPIEWGVRWTGVDQYADSLAQPVVANGEMEPLPESPGFGPLVNADWLAEQDVDDPDGIVPSQAD
jgi:L-alanine-DL-glutamate epimerase-like enolase superfamily enzyme